MNNQNDYYLHIGRASELKNSKERRLFRFFEMSVGMASWITLALLVVFSWIYPMAAAIFVIVFDTYWFFKILYFTIHAFHSFKIIKANRDKNWLEELKSLSKEKYTVGHVKDWREIYNLVIFPMYKEGYDVVSSTFKALQNINFPLDKFIVVLALEDRAGDEPKAMAKKIEKEFSHLFLHFMITVHPSDLEGELAGKGSNETWAAIQAKKVIDDLKLPYDKILASSFDIDTQLPKDYFGCLLYNFLTAKHPMRSSYQPIALFTNNIWEAPALARVISFSASFWQIIQQSRPERMRTFSSHSMPFSALVEIGFWQKNVVSEDSRVFWQCFFRYDGDWRTVPLFFPVTMDANVDRTFWKTLVNQYKQQLRWAYGVADMAYVLFGFYKNKKISIGKKIEYGFFNFEGYYSWGVSAIIISFLGWLPLFLGGHGFSHTLLSFNFVNTSSWVMRFSLIGVVSCAIVNLWFVPPRPISYGRWRYVVFVLQWIMMPINLIFFGSIPAMEAQTRLMLKKYMGFWVTPKFRKGIQS